MPEDRGCLIPPPGYWCSRPPGHDGPCAMRQASVLADVLPDEDPEAVELVAASAPSAGAFTVDLDKLTVLDMMDLEDELGIGLRELKESLAAKDARMGRILAHMVWFEMRREDPSITLRQAAASVPLAALAGEDDPGKSGAGSTTSV